LIPALQGRVRPCHAKISVAPINHPPRPHAWKAIGLTIEGRMIFAVTGIRVPTVFAGGAPIVLMVLMV